MVLESAHLVLVSYVLLGIAAVMAVVKIYVKLHTVSYHSDKKLTGKTAIVTGGNSGIGKETARDLARRGARVILGCRDFRKGNRVREELIRSTGNRDIVVRLLDLSSMTSTRAFVGEICKFEDHVDILVNNAGVLGLGKKWSEDGLLMEMQVNHIGPFLMTNLLIDLLKKSAPARIIFVSCFGDSRTPAFNVDDLNFDRSYKNRRVYHASKLANIISANELARKLQGTGVTVNSLHPGVAATNLYNNLFPTWLIGALNWLAGILAKTPVEGAQTTIYLAVDEEVEGVTGKYFADCKEKQVCDLAKDEGLAKKLWEKCELLVESSL